MNKKDAIEHFGSQQALADALGIKQPSVAAWKNIPAIRQIQLEAITEGALRADLPEYFRKQAA